VKVLMSALSCEPNQGSEPEVGYRAVLAAARRHDVWLLTMEATLPAVKAAIQGRPEAARIHFEGIAFGVTGEAYNRLTLLGFHRHYDRWQRDAVARAIELDRRIDFDLVHHVTLASYWTRAGVAVVDKPLVWGPVGGGVNPPLSLLSELGPRGFVEDAVRALSRPLLAALPGIRRTRRAATITFAQNKDTAARIRTSGSLRVLSNALAVELPDVPPGGDRNCEILFVGRIVAWKAPLLALRAFRRMRNQQAVLRFFGEGPERGRVERAAARWGLADRVRFEGLVPRARLLATLARAGVLLHPSLHDEASLSIAEALSLGTPVVCLDRGGPGELVEQWPDTPSAKVRPQRPETVARRMAEAIDEFLSAPPPVRKVPSRATTSFADELLDAYDSAAGLAASNPAGDDRPLDGLSSKSVQLGRIDPSKDGDNPQTTEDEQGGIPQNHVLRRFPLTRVQKQAVTEDADDKRNDRQP
jgi:Glycosyl transferases group 1